MMLTPIDSNLKGTSALESCNFPNINNFVQRSRSDPFIAPIIIFTSLTCYPIPLGILRWYLFFRHAASHTHSCRLSRLQTPIFVGHPSSFQMLYILPGRMNTLSMSLGSRIVGNSNYEALSYSRYLNELLASREIVITLNNIEFPITSTLVCALLILVMLKEIRKIKRTRQIRSHNCSIITAMRKESLLRLTSIIG